MEFAKDDKITIEDNKTYHESAGGFVFYEEPSAHKLFVALIKPEDNENLFIPKGHLKNGEKPKEAAVREIQEELSLKISLDFVTELGASEYSFDLGDGVTHFKKIHIYIFSSPEKTKLLAPENENIEKADWYEFYEALGKLAYDKENLLKARQLFYYHKIIIPLKSIEDIKSITVGIPTYNGSKTIENTITSILNSLVFLPEKISKKLIICCDHCTDNSKKMAENFLLKNPDGNIEFEVCENNRHQGKATVLNEIMSRTQSDLLCFIDDDVDLNKECFFELIKPLISNRELRCTYAWWVRKKFVGKSYWKKFWHWILGVKFDLPLFDHRPEYMRGACMMFRRDNYVYLSPKIVNEDQFLQYIYWPQTKEIESAKVYFHSVEGIKDYYKRFIRIMAGGNQLDDEFSKDRIKKCNDDLLQKINFKNIRKSPWKLKAPFYFYRFIRYFVNKLVKIRLKHNHKYEWHRINQG